MGTCNTKTAPRSEDFFHFVLITVHISEHLLFVSHIHCLSKMVVHCLSKKLMHCLSSYTEWTKCPHTGWTNWPYTGCKLLMNSMNTMLIHSMTRAHLWLIAHALPNNKKIIINRKLRVATKIGSTFFWFLTSYRAAEKM
jgi:hypothetical protein